jgi:MFS family permease
VSTSSPRVTYVEVLRVREFRAMFVSQGLSLIGDQMARLAIALLVYERSGSAFAASATYGCSFLTWLVGGPILSALADRHRRRQIMIVSDVARGLLVALLLVAHPPLWLVFSVLVAVGLLAPPFESARSAILPDIVSGEAYATANTLINTTIQAAQVGGFFLGGLLVAAVSPRGALAIDVATFAVSALMLKVAVRDRPATAVTKTTLLSDVSAGFSFVAHEPVLRALLTYGVLAAVVAIVPEGLAVAVASDDGNGAVAAGVLTAALPLGYVLASVAILRVPAERRPGLLRPLALLLCVPLLLTPFVPGTTLTALLWFTSGLGTSVQLVASVAYVAATPAAFRGRAFGIASTLLMLGQGTALLLAGALAEVAGSRAVVAGTAALGLLVVLLVGRTSRLGQMDLQESPSARRI